MKVVLFFIALSAWSAQDFCIPSRWTRNLDVEAGVQKWTSPHHSGLFNIYIIRQTKKAEMIHFSLPHHDVFLAMDCTDYDRGAIFNVEVTCKNCRQRKEGFVFAYPLDDQIGRFQVIEPKEEPEIYYVRFSKAGTHKPKVFCEYWAEETHFTTQRFLCEYDDLSRYFVSAQVTYNCPYQVVIEWGKRAKDNAVMDVSGENRKEFNFALCQKGQCLRRAD